MPGFEDQMFGGIDDLRRSRILTIFRNRDVDPNMLPTGEYEPGRLDRLVADKGVSFDDIRRAAQLTQHNGFTIREMQANFESHQNITMANPGKFVDQSFSIGGVQPYEDDEIEPTSMVVLPEDEQDIMIQEEATEQLAYTDDQGNPLTSEELVNPEITPGKALDVPEVQPEGTTAPEPTTPTENIEQ